MDLETQVALLRRIVGETNLGVYRNDGRLAYLEAMELLRSAGQTPRFPVEFRAQFGEDSLIWSMLGRQMSGFFVEAGAFNGYDYSATYALEAIGWTGLLVEPIPEQASECRTRRPGSQVVNAALSDTIGTATFNVSDDQYGGMLSKLAHPDQRYYDALPPGSVNVQTVTLDSILSGHEGPIDAAVIDVEGSELSVLRGFNLEKHRPRVLLIEDNTYGADPAIGDYMSKQPYKMVAWRVVNRVYVHESEREILNQFASVQV